VSARFCDGPVVISRDEMEDVARKRLQGRVFAIANPGKNPRFCVHERFSNSSSLSWTIARYPSRSIGSPIRRGRWPVFPIQETFAKPFDMKDDAFGF